MKTIPYGHQSIDRKDIQAVIGVLRSRWLTQGLMIDEFERALCEYTGARFALVVSSGTAALHVASLAAGFGKRDEVVTSPITFVASANCALYCGARPVFADVQPETANIDPYDILKKISGKTMAIIAVHYAGQPCDMAKIRTISRKKGLVIIEDAAHAIGSTYKGSKIGSCKYSDMTVFSFHPVKTITTGEGGAVMTNDRNLYNSLKMYRNHGITKDPSLLDKRMKDCGWYYEMKDLGFNYRMTDIQAALGVAQLRKLDRFIERRRKIARIYDKALAGNDFFDIPVEKEGCFSAYHLYPIRLKRPFKNKKKAIFSYMRKNGVGVQVHYIPVYRQPYYRELGFKENICPNAEDFYRSEISLPIYPDMTPNQIGCVIKVLMKAFAKT